MHIRCVNILTGGCGVKANENIEKKNGKTLRKNIKTQEV